MNKQQDIIWANEVLKKINKKMEIVSEKSKDKIPSTSIAGVHNDKTKEKKDVKCCDGIDWWTNGCFAGVQWYLYNYTNKEEYKKIANHQEDMLDECFERFYGLHHDVGFMWLNSAVANYRLTGNEKSRKRGLMAATLLAGRYNPNCKMLRAWNGENNMGWGIIDSLMNINLLYWASEETKDPRFKSIAMLHADTIMKYFIREDGSAKHICTFDPMTGKYLGSLAGQGYEHGSSWTRGQGWAVYGFILSYIHTKKQEYLDTAKKIGNYIIENISDNKIIPIDFKQPKDVDYEDSTATCIIACGLLELEKALNTPDNKYYNVAVELLKTLDKKRCDYTLEDDCIVKMCSNAYNQTHNHTLVYADEFYIEAISKIIGKDIIVW